MWIYGYYGRYFWIVSRYSRSMTVFFLSRGTRRILESIRAKKLSSVVTTSWCLESPRRGLFSADGQIVEADRGRTAIIYVRRRASHSFSVGVMRWCSWPPQGEGDKEVSIRRRYFMVLLVHRYSHREDRYRERDSDAAAISFRLARCDIHGENISRAWIPDSSWKRAVISTDVVRLSNGPT